MAVHSSSKYKFFLAVFVLLFVTSFCIAETESWNKQQLQKIDHSVEEFSFAVLGDNRNSTDIFEKIIQKLNEDETLFAINLGDTVQEGTRERFSFFLRQLEKLKKPMLTVLGNHELRQNGRAVYAELFGDFYYSFSVGKSYFILLDDANWERLDPKQWEWLLAELKKSQDYQYRFVLMHIPLFDPREGEKKKGHSMTNLRQAEKLNKLLDDNNMTMIFTSHIHGYYDGIWGETPFIITGGAGASLKGSDPRYFFYHYIKVKVSKDGVTFKVVKIK